MRTRTLSLLLVAGAVVLLLAVWTTVMLAVPHGGTTAAHATASPTPHGRTTAIRLCHKAVKRRLRSPATAKWPAGKAIPSGDGYIVLGAVDSENGFGAVVRSTYECHAAPGTDGVWAVEVTRLAQRGG